MIESVTTFKQSEIFKIWSGFLIKHTFPYLLPFTVLFGSFVDVSHHPLILPPCSFLVLLFSGPFLFPFCTQTSLKSPNSMLGPAHPGPQLHIAQGGEGNRVHLHHCCEQQLLSVHLLRSQILLVHWELRQVNDATLNPKLLCCPDELWDV